MPTDATDHGSSRRDLLKHLGLGTALAAAGCDRLLKTGDAAHIVGGDKPLDQQQLAGAPAVHTGKTFRWRVVTTWPTSLPVFSEGVERIAETARRLSGGRLQIEVFGAGELVPALETFQAVSQGIAELGHGAAYYWAGKIPAAQFFTSVPFGMNTQQSYAWTMAGGGWELWRDAYADFGLVPIPAGNSGMQMAGWFTQKIESMEDFRGLKMRIPGLGGKVLARAGGAPELIPGGEIYTSLERGVIDATEWVGPYHDYTMGFHNVAKHYYYPGWHEPTGVLELIVNRQKWNSLPRDLQAILTQAALDQNLWMLSEMEHQNIRHLRLLQEEEGVDVRPLPREVLANLKQHAEAAISELADEDPLSRRVYDHYRAFRRRAQSWGKISEEAYFALMHGN